MRAHYLQHVPFEGLGSIEAWLRNKGYATSCTRLFESVNFPNMEEIDLLIIMGGPMSVNDEKEYSWLVKEKAFIRMAIDSGTPVLGICLGAQLIANCLGAKVYPNPQKEIGWFPIHSIGEESSLFFKFPKSIEVFHWHGETFDLPPGATLIASSEACKNQGFQIGSSVMGLQFHLETTPESASDIIANCRDELVPAKYVQNEVDLLAVKTERYYAINVLMAEVLEFLQP